MENILISKKIQYESKQQKITFHEDLSKYEGKMIALSICISPDKIINNSPTVLSPFYIKWDQLSIEGYQEKIQVKDPGIVKDKYNVLIVLFDALRA